jgi:hypothetical protein
MIGVRNVWLGIQKATQRNMQTLPGQEQFHAVSVGTQTRNAVFVALILFALAGLISGFSVGAFVHPKKTTQITLPNQPSHTLQYNLFR